MRAQQGQVAPTLRCRPQVWGKRQPDTYIHPQMHVSSQQWVKIPAAMFEITAPDLCRSQTPLSHNIYVADSDIAYKFQQSLRHRQADNEVKLTVISYVAGQYLYGVRVWSGPAGSAGALLLCYLRADGPVEPYHRCRRLKCCWGTARRKPRVPILFNCLQVPDHHRQSLWQLL